MYSHCFRCACVSRGVSCQDGHLHVPHQSHAEIHLHYTPRGRPPAACTHGHGDRTSPNFPTNCREKTVTNRMIDISLQEQKTLDRTNLYRVWPSLLLLIYILPVIRNLHYLNCSHCSQLISLCLCFVLYIF